LYRQDPPGFFVEAGGQSGLHAAGWAFVGWGTQFLDADCDGEPDLVVANGHVDDFAPREASITCDRSFFATPAAAGSSSFWRVTPVRTSPASTWGAGWRRLDWNRDGKMDFAVSNIGDRASLVTNRSQRVVHFLNVKLHARLTARDAIGTVVEVVGGHPSLSKQLVAGDGYMASNERLLNFGLGDASGVTELR